MSVIQNEKGEVLMYKGETVIWVHVDSVVERLIEGWAYRMSRKVA